LYSYAAQNLRDAVSKISIRFLNIFKTFYLNSFQRKLLTNLKNVMIYMFRVFTCCSCVTQRFIHIASLRCLGFHSRREGQRIQNHCLCNAHGWHEVQTEGSRGTSWGRWRGGKISTPPPTHTHTHTHTYINTAIS
jgi:hypothetical protein